METTLFDGRGHPGAYIADDGENSVYLWSGHAVAYVVGELVYGWNGRHLGWFVDGVVYDLQGQRVGSVRERCPYATYAEPAKYAKYSPSLMGCGNHAARGMGHLAITLAADFEVQLNGCALRFQ